MPDILGSGVVVGGFIAGIVAIVVGGGLAVVTAAGVIEATTEAPTQPKTEVVEYGSNQ